MRYKVADDLKDKNLRIIGYEYPVEMTDEVVAILKREWCDTFEYKGYMTMHAWEIEEMGIPYEAVKYGDGTFDDEYFDDIHWELIKPSERYLVYASGCRWNGASGYKLADSFNDAIYRQHDASIFPRRVSKGGKTLECKEYSHDAPMGNLTYIIALTDNEYKKLKESDFDEVRRFVEKQAEKLPA